MEIERHLMHTEAIADDPSRDFGRGRLVGLVRRFGSGGVPYEVVGEVSDDEVCIRVITTGEICNYPVADVLTDPED